MINKIFSKKNILILSSIISSIIIVVSIVLYNEIKNITNIIQTVLNGLINTILKNGELIEILFNGMIVLMVLLLIMAIVVYKKDKDKVVGVQIISTATMVTLMLVLSKGVNLIGEVSKNIRLSNWRYFLSFDITKLSNLDYLVTATKFLVVIAVMTLLFNIVISCKRIINKNKVIKFFNYSMICLVIIMITLGSATIYAKVFKTNSMDPFEKMEVVFAGFNTQGSAFVTNGPDLYLQDASEEINKFLETVEYQLVSGVNGSLSNGDKLVYRLAYDIEMAKQLDIEFKQRQIEFEVSNLVVRYDEYEEVPNKIINKFNELIDTSVLELTDESSFGGHELVLLDQYFAVSDSLDNCLIQVFKYTQKYDLKLFSIDRVSYQVMVLHDLDDRFNEHNVNFEIQKLTNMSLTNKTISSVEIQNMLEEQFNNMVFEKIS